MENWKRGNHILVSELMVHVIIGVCTCVHVHVPHQCTRVKSQVSLPSQFPVLFSCLKPCAANSVCTTIRMKTHSNAFSIIIIAVLYKHAFPLYPLPHPPPVVMSMGSLCKASGESRATSSMFIPPWELATITGPWSTVICSPIQMYTKCKNLKRPEIKPWTIFHGFWSKSESLTLLKLYQRKEHLKRSRMAQISAS